MINCFICGSTDHNWSDCPNLLARVPTPPKAPTMFSSETEKKDEPSSLAPTRLEEVFGLDSTAALSEVDSAWPGDQQDVAAKIIMGTPPSDVDQGVLGEIVESLLYGRKKAPPTRGPSPKLKGPLTRLPD